MGQGLSRGSTLSFSLTIGLEVHRFTVRLSACAHQFHIPIPDRWRRENGLTWGDPVLLLEVEPGLFTLQITEGASEKELLRLGNVLAHMHIQRERAEIQRRVDGAYTQGWFHGAGYGYWDYARKGECFNPAHWTNDARE